MSQIIKPGSGGGAVTLVNDNTTVQWSVAGSTYTQDFGLANLLIGSDGTGSSSSDVNFNVAVGDGAMGALTAGFDNVAIGYNAMENATSGGGQIAIGALALSSNPIGSGDSAENVAIGYQCLEDLTAGTQNVCIGTTSGSSLVTGSANIAIGTGTIGALTTTTLNEPNISIGFESLGNLTSGGLNIAIGHNAGHTLTSTESNNIYLGNVGVVSESGTLRIGGATPSTPAGNITLSAAYIEGIAGVTTSNSQMVTINSSTGQLGSAAVPSGSVFGPIIDSGAQVASSLTTVTIPYIAGNPNGSFVSTVNVSNTSIYLAPIYLDETKTYVAMGTKVTNTPGAGSTVDYVLYNSAGTGGLPGTVVASALNVSTAASGIAEGSISVAITPGYYWIGVQRNATATVTISGVSNGDPFSTLTNKAFINLASLSTSPYETFSFFGATNTYGTYPSNPTLTQNQPTNVMPIVYIR